MPLTQTPITSVSHSTGEADLHVNWTGTLPAGYIWQIYIDTRLVLSTFKNSAVVPLPPHSQGRKVPVDIAAVELASRNTDLSASLPARPADRARLWFYGGLYLSATIVRYDVYSGTAPGGAVDYSAPVGSAVASANGVFLNGFGFGGFGAGGFGSGATYYSWTSEPLAPGTWNFGIKAVDSGGQSGPPKTFSQAVTGPPQAPPPNAAGLRLTGSYNAGTRVLTLSWLASQP